MKLELILSEREFRDLRTAIDDAIAKQRSMENTCKSDAGKERHKFARFKYEMLRRKLMLAKSCLEEGT